MNEMEKWVTEAEVKATLEKFEGVGLISRDEKGVYSILFSPFERTIRKPLRKLTDEYGDLKGKEAVILAVVPPQLFFRPSPLSEITAAVNLAFEVTPELQERFR